MVSAGVVASCLALLAPARGFVSPIVTRTPGAEVRVSSCHRVFTSEVVVACDSGRSTRRGVGEMRAMNDSVVVSSYALICSDEQSKLAKMSFVSVCKPLT